MRILIIGATHGNEALGPKLYQRLLQKRSPLLEHIDFILGNPRAYHARKRYIDCDLNRSYGATGQKYEEVRASQIAEHINSTRPDIILDMHTTSCHQPNCLIVHSTSDSRVRRMLRASHIETILQVKPMGDIATVASNVVGYEVPNRNVTPQLLDAITDDLTNFLHDEGNHPQKRLFTMTDKIMKSEVTPEDVASFKNFEMHPMGFVPIMTGNNSYKKQTDYLGFKADAGEDIIISTAIIEK